MTNKTIVDKILNPQPIETPVLEEITTTETDLTLLQERLKHLKESQQKTQRIVKEMLVQLDELEALEKRTLEVLLKRLEKQ